ncbi:MAG: metallophosphoesterase [Candidatus Altiarchaeota archaeon]|nr:metallophosphoesterase [Candidatus Altiarchaeota archaeon]
MNKNIIAGLILLSLGFAGVLFFLHPLENDMQTAATSTVADATVPTERTDATSVESAAAETQTTPVTTMPAASRTEGNFTIIVLPDTQKYMHGFIHLFANQTEWIVSQIAARNIVFVIQEGDLVDDASSEFQWKVANSSMSILDGKIPYSVLPGNHDKSNTYNVYFNPSRFAGYPWYGGNYSGNNNNYQLFTAGGEDYIAISLEACPPMDAIDWANRILQENNDRKAIVTTHGYTNLNAERNVHACGDTTYIWDSLIAPNQNVFLVLNGHTHGESRRSDTINGRTVHQLLADYQEMAEGGSGFLRILTFAPAEGKIYVETYSPRYGKFKNDNASNFTLDLQ